jgi:hypothetical protein
MLFYIIKVAQDGGRQLHCMFCTAWLCYAELFEKIPAFPGWFHLLLQFLPQDLMSPLESRTPGFACNPRERNPTQSSPGSEGTMLLGLHIQSVTIGFIEILTDAITAVWPAAIILERFCGLRRPSSVVVVVVVLYPNVLFGGSYVLDAKWRPYCSILFKICILIVR